MRNRLGRSTFRLPARVVDQRLGRAHWHEADHPQRRKDKVSPNPRLADELLDHPPGEL
jgi:hypothetical protein